MPSLLLPGHTSEPGPEPLPTPPPNFVLNAVFALRRLLLRLADLVVPAHLAMFEQSTGIARTHTLGAVARHRLVDHLGDEALTSEELARRAHVDPDATHRVMRALVGVGIFSMDADGRFRNNRLSRALATGTLERGRDWVEYYSSASHALAWADFARTLQTGSSAFDRVHGMTTWEWFERNPDERETFAHAMMGLTVNQAPLVAARYPFEEVETVCDLGGGRGTLLSELLVRHPHLRGTLVDAEGVLESARSLLERRGVASRVAFVPCNFFEDPIPPGADLYILKNVLHDWDDARCEHILRNCRRGMPSGTRLVIVESLVERHDTVGIGPLSDVQMMVSCSDGRERSREELEGLLTRTGFTPSRLFESPIISIIEGIASEDASSRAPDAVPLRKA
ncbi:MAG: methyltransferase, partial [Myxococcaceae bacterium]